MNDLNILISVIGLGFVGQSIYDSLCNKGFNPNVNIFGFDIAKQSHTFQQCLSSNIMFLALPTQYNAKIGQYDKSAIRTTCKKLVEHHYQGVVVIKSTVEPSTTDGLANAFPSLQFVHNPEFLTARTAYHDFHCQNHVVLGQAVHCDDKWIELLSNFYSTYYTDNISVGTAMESESMKSFANSFYSVKIQFFTELFLLCQKTDCNYDVVKGMMLKNNWINPQHTTVPGPDGLVSYGGLCFPKDTNALAQHMKRHQSPSSVLDATIDERNSMRNDHDNCTSDDDKASTQ